MYKSISILLVLVGLINSIQGADDLLIAKTTAGTVTGFYNENGIRQWKGIPYATPPVGELRWETAIPAPMFPNGEYSATFDAGKVY